MKSVLFLVLFFLFYKIPVIAQNKDTIRNNVFFMTIAAGPCFGAVNEKIDKNDYTYEGIGPVFEIVMGGKISKKLALHTSVIYSNINVKNMYYPGSDKNTSIKEVCLYLGITHYFNYSNAYFSFNVGYGGMSNSERKKGVSLFCKLMKEYSLSKKVGLGLGIGYGKTLIQYKTNGLQDKIDSNRIGIFIHLNLY